MSATTPLSNNSDAKLNEIMRRVRVMAFFLASSLRLGRIFRQRFSCGVT